MVGGLASNLKSKSGGKRDFLQTLEAPRSAGMSCLHIRAQKQQVVVGLEGAELRHPFRQLPISDTRIGEAGKRKYVRVVLCPHIVVGRIGGDRPIGGGVLD